MLRNLKRYFSNNFFFFYKQDKSPTQRYPFSNKIQSTKKISKYLTLIIVHRKLETRKSPVITRFSSSNATRCSLGVLPSSFTRRVKLKFTIARNTITMTNPRGENHAVSADVYSRAEKVGRFGDVSTRRGI